jgi:uncharacterized membrane protein
MYNWIKALHIVFIASWFAGLFYLPRIYVNLAMETDAAARERLLLMAGKLYRFTSILKVPALARLSASTLETALAQAAQVDRMIKGLRAKQFTGDAWDAMLQLALKIAR